MSLHDYRRAVDLHTADEPFYALVMAAILRADTANRAVLMRAFPETAAELASRWGAPRGLLPGEPGRAALDEARDRLGLPPA